MSKTSKMIIGGIAVLALSMVTYLYLDHLLYDGIKPKILSENGLKASFFAKEKSKNRPAVILIGGGHWGDYWGQEFAKANYVGLSLPYHREEGLPKRLAEIPLEYFEEAVQWLMEQPEVNPDQIIVMGASRNAELALLIASTFPNRISGVIAFNPSAVSWSNTVLPFNSDDLRPSWTYKDQAIPYIAMEKIKGAPGSTIETLSYWKNGLSDSLAVDKALIQVENIKGPILLLSGRDDEVWPSALMSDMIEERIQNSQFSFDFENIKYENAGHLISSNPNNSSSMRQGKMEVEGKKYDFNFGGTETGDKLAQVDARKRVFEFILKL